MPVTSDPTAIASSFETSSLVSYALRPEPRTDDAIDKLDGKTIIRLP